MNSQKDELLSVMQAWYGNTAAFQNWFVNRYLILKCFHNDLAYGDVAEMIRQISEGEQSDFL